MRKLLLSFFRSCQMSGHQRSPKVKFCRFQHFSANRLIARESEEVQRCETAHSIALSLAVLRFDLKRTFGLQRAKNRKNSRFYEKLFFTNYFWLRKNSAFVFCQHRVSLVKTRQMNCKLTLKGHVKKIWPHNKVMTWSEKVIMHISRSVASLWTHLSVFVSL